MSDLQLLALALDPRTKDLLMVDQEIKTKTWKTLTNYALEVCVLNKKITSVLGQQTSRKSRGDEDS